jgi:type III secretion protein R
MTSTSPLLLAFIVVAATLLPSLVLVGTSYVKVSVVLGSVRNALGTPRMPGNLVVVGLSVILSLHIMAPTGAAVVRDAGAALTEALAREPGTPESVAALGRAWDAARPHAARFLRANATSRNRGLFLDLARRARERHVRDGIAGAELVPAPTDGDLAVLLPAFVVSELERAFQIAFLVLLPFVVVELVVANILVALGLQSLPSTTVSLPFKLLLFVMADGWYQLSRALVLGYR